MGNNKQFLGWGSVALLVLLAIARLSRNSDAGSLPNSPIPERIDATQVTQLLED